MNCNCLVEIEARIPQEGDFKGKKIESAELDKAFLLEKNGLKTSTYTIAKLEVEGYKKSQEINFNHTFCPFCGIKI